MRRALFAAAAVLAWPGAAVGQTFPCGSVEAMERALRDVHREVPVAAGVMDETAQFRIYASPGGATWTAMVITADGRACLVDAGAHWRQGPMPAPAKPGRPA